MSKTIVAFCGRKGHGKDTAAKVLLAEGYEQVSFADRLRQTVAHALGEDVSYFTDPATKEEIDPRTGKPRRYWLQWIGTEGFRALWNDIWLAAWKQDVDKLGDKVVCCDMRFHNEFDYVKNMPNAITVRVRNPRIPLAPDAHESELYADDFDVDIELTNDGTIAALHANLLIQLEQFRSLSKGFGA